MSYHNKGWTDWEGEAWKIILSSIGNSCSSLKKLTVLWKSESLLFNYLRCIVLSLCVSCERVQMACKEGWRKRYNILKEKPPCTWFSFPAPIKVNYQAWLDSSLPPWHLTAANSLINLINVIMEGFGVGCHCSADSVFRSACHLIQFCCDFPPPSRKDVWAAFFSFQHQELSAADSNYFEPWLPISLLENKKVTHFHHLP